MHGRLVRHVKRLEAEEEEEEEEEVDDEEEEALEREYAHVNYVNKNGERKNVCVRARSVRESEKKRARQRDPKGERAREIP